MALQVFVFLSTIVAFLLAVTFHECMHAVVAYMLGDDTAKRAGRLTLNPIKHIDPLGFLLILLIRVGWAKPVPINPKNFKYPGFYSVLVGFAGPLSNFFLAVVSLYAFKYFTLYYPREGILFFLREFLMINVILGMFNILPIPPLDGSHVIQALLPQEWKETYYKLQPFTLLIVVVIFSIPAVQRTFFHAVQGMIILLSKLVV